MEPRREIAMEKMWVDRRELPSVDLMARRWEES